MTQTPPQPLTGRGVRDVCEQLTSSGDAVIPHGRRPPSPGSRAAFYRNAQLRAEIEAAPTVPPVEPVDDVKPRQPVSGNLTRRVEQACASLLRDGNTVTFVSVAERSGLGRATLYRHPELAAIVRRFPSGPHSEQADEEGLDGVRRELVMLRAQIDRQETAIRDLISVVLETNGRDQLELA